MKDQNEETRKFGDNLNLNNLIETRRYLDDCIIAAKKLVRALESVHAELCRRGGPDEETIKRLCDDVDAYSADLHTFMYYDVKWR